MTIAATTWPFDSEMVFRERKIGRRRVELTAVLPANRIWKHPGLRDVRGYGRNFDEALENWTEELFQAASAAGVLGTRAATSAIWISDQASAATPTTFTIKVTE